MREESLTDRIFNGIYVVLIIIIIFISVGLIFSIIQDNVVCKSKGGEMVGTGEYQTTYVTTGAVIMPMTTEVQGCTK